MRIKDVHEAREKADKQLREKEMNEAKRLSERETRLECERLGIEARRNDAMLRAAKKKKERAARTKMEKAKLKARVEAQKMAQAVRKARAKAGEEEAKAGV